MSEHGKTLEQSIGENASASTLLLSMESANYSKSLPNVMESFLTNRKGDAVYVTFNKPAVSLAELFKGIDHKNRMLFLDVISAHTGEKASEMENAFFVSYPGDLTGVMVVLSRTLKMHQFKFLFLDSLSSVLIYNDERTTTRFLHALAAMCKQNSVHLVMLASEDLPQSFSSSISSLASAQIAAASA